jgi:hypothetical protein
VPSRSTANGKSALLSNATLQFGKGLRKLAKKRFPVHLVQLARDGDRVEHQLPTGTEWDVIPGLGLDRDARTIGAG